MDRSTKLTLPELSLVLLIGASSSGKSTFAGRHFKPTEIISSDFCRAVVSDDANDLSATTDAFEVLHFITGKRLAAGRLTVIDATNVQPESRRSLLSLARDHYCLSVAIVFDLPERLLKERNRQRSDRSIPPPAIARQVEQMRRSLRQLQKEGFHRVYILSSPEDVDAATVERQRLWTDLRHEHGPFDIIGDVHGCFSELVALLRRLGYSVVEDGELAGTRTFEVTPPPGRKVIFLGDLADRGPSAANTLRLVMSMVKTGTALCVPGNHDVKLARALQGRKVQVTHGLERSLEQLGGEPAEFKAQVAEFIEKLVSHYVLDDGRLVVAHAGMKSAMQGRASKHIRDFALYGETTGETDEFGLPVRINWANEYRGSALVVYGHTPVLEPEWQNNTINIDTGCVFGRKLTALRYPEKELMSVPAEQIYYQPAKPIGLGVASSAPAKGLEILDIGDVTGKRLINTEIFRNIMIREDQAHAALEVMSRFAIDPRWLIYLPPTMAPAETTDRPGLLEHPAEAFGYYQRRGMTQVLCQEKHMGSRAIVIVSRNAEAARRRFGIAEDRSGTCYTRTGRPFFDNRILETALLDRVKLAVNGAGIWDELETDWLALDCELMPWSVKAEDLLKEQYAAVATAARTALSEAVAAIDAATSRGLDLTPLEGGFRSRLVMVKRYAEVYRRYVWPVQSVDDLRLAPFHLLATEGAVHTDKDHLWHMQMLERICEADESAPRVVSSTPYRVVNLDESPSQEEAFRWWEAITDGGGEGIVTKPLAFTPRSSRGLLQPALKTRGREYLRLIYGPEYSEPGNLERLRPRALARKRSLALREFALGIEALSRFVRKEPLYRVHECVFGVLALESEPVDPRL